MNSYKHLFFFVSILFFSVITPVNAAPFFTTTADAPTLIQKFLNYSANKKPVSVLIVAGHDAEQSGAQFGNLSEAVMNADLADRIVDKLNRVNGLAATSSRPEGNYLPDLKAYLDSHKESAIGNAIFQKNLAGLLYEGGVLDSREDAPHSTVAKEIAAKLYGTSEWINQNGFDFVLHVHFNDYGSHARGKKGAYSGISMYIPDQQFGNGRASSFIAVPIFRRLHSLYEKSDYPKEDKGIMEDQSLIALGVNNTLNPATALVEYGYIYEKQFSDRNIRNAVFEALATETCKGVVEFFAPARSDLLQLCGAVELPIITHSLKKGVESAEVFKLQRALSSLNLFPAKGYSRKECTLNGTFGPCTEKAVKAFQKKYKISVTGIAGKLTLSKLQSLIPN